MWWWWRGLRGESGKKDLSRGAGGAKSGVLGISFHLFRRWQCKKDHEAELRDPSGGHEFWLSRGY